MNQFMVVAVAEKISAMQTETFFAGRRAEADREAFLRILNLEGSDPPWPDDVIKEYFADVVTRSTPG